MNNLIDPFNGRRWKYVVEVPSLWSKACVRMTHNNHQDILNSDPTLFTGRVGLKTCSLRDEFFQLESLLQAIIASNNSNLKSLELHGCSTGYIRSGLGSSLFRVLTRLEELKLYRCYLPWWNFDAMLWDVFSFAGKPKKLFALGNEVELTGLEAPESLKESLFEKIRELQIQLENEMTLHLTASFKVLPDGPECLYLGFDALTPPPWTT